MSSLPPYQERLHEAAAATRDLLAHLAVGRWEVFAKASYTRELDVGLESLQQVVHAEEMGVAVRTFRNRRAGFAAASGLEPGASRRAVDGALANDTETREDPLPPAHLLGLNEAPPPPALPPQGWAIHVLDGLSQALLSSSGGSLSLLRAVIQEGSLAWILTTSEGFVATCEDTLCSLLAEVVIAGEGRRVWREWLPISKARHFDPAAAAANIANRLMLTQGRIVRDSGLRDVILHGEVVAGLMAALVPLFVAQSSDCDPLPRLLDRDGRLASPALMIIDDRRGSTGLIRGPCDGEGLPAGRVLLLEEGVPRHRLASYRDAMLHGETPRGGALRLSYRDYPRTGIANLEVTGDSISPAEMLSQTDRALYLLRPLASVIVDLAADSYRLVASGVWLSRGRPLGWHPVVELKGSLGGLLRRIEAVGTDTRWFQTERGCIGAPSLLIRRQPVLT